MNGRIVGALLGVAGAFLWFMPLAYIQFMGIDAYQAGHHIGGIAYLMLLALLAYAMLSWIDQHVPRIIAAAVALAVSLLFLVDAGSSSAWGLIGIVAISIAAVITAMRDQRGRANSNQGSNG